MTDEPKFRPKPLPKASIEAPMEAHWQVMGPEEAKRLHRHALAEHHRFNPFGPRLRKRFATVTFGTAVAFVILGLLLIAWSVRALLLFAAVGFVLGAIVAILRPRDFLAGTLYALASLCASLWIGLHVLLALIAMMAFYSIGIMTGRVEDGKALDGE